MATLSGGKDDSLPSCHSLFVTMTDNVRFIMILIPKNWAFFQHYKDRLPPWIKLHREILNDRVYMGLPIASKALAPLMWLLASESKNGTFDGSLDELVFRLHITPKEYQDGVKPLIDKGFFVHASNTLADCKQLAIPETERERETETDKRQKATVVATPDGVSQSVFDDFKTLRKAKKAPITQRVLDGMQEQADIAGWTLEKAMAECCVRGWQAFKAEWVTEKPKLVNRFDVAHVTVPSSSQRDPALVKLDEDSKRTSAPNPENLARIRAILGKTA